MGGNCAGGWTVVKGQRLPVHNDCIIMRPSIGGSSVGSEAGSGRIGQDADQALHTTSTTIRSLQCRREKGRAVVFSVKGAAPPPMACPPRPAPPLPNQPSPRPPPCSPSRRRRTSPGRSSSSASKLVEPWRTDREEGGPGEWGGRMVKHESKPFFRATSNSFM